MAGTFELRHLPQPTPTLSMCLRRHLVLRSPRVRTPQQLCTFSATKLPIYARPSRPTSPSDPGTRRTSVFRRLFSHVPIASEQPVLSPNEAKDVLESITWRPPPQCPGCGAPAQHVNKNLPGYYPQDKARKKLRLHAAKIKVATDKARAENETWKNTLERISTTERMNTTNTILRDLGIMAPVLHTDGLAGPKQDASLSTEGIQEPQEVGTSDIPLVQRLPVPSLKSQQLALCDRCHSLIHERRGLPLPSYPTVDTIAALLYSSPHKYHQIYQLIDAADFPLSVNPALRRHLENKLSAKISRHMTWTYIITRADLLFPKQPLLEEHMPWLRRTLERVLPRGGLQPEDQVLYISSRRGWNVGRVKKMVTKSRGATWFVGSVNVGKSSLLRDVWPEGGQIASGALPLDDAERFGILPESHGDPEPGQSDAKTDGPEKKDADKDVKTNTQKLGKAFTKSQKPMAELEQPGPIRIPPTITSIPGTTAAPIRVSFEQANTSGVISRHSRAHSEVIDLPGLERWVGFGEMGLIKYVREEHRKKIVMEERVKAEEFTIKPGQSLLLGGLYLLTPRNLSAGTVVLVNSFTTLPVHICATGKALSYISCPDPDQKLVFGGSQKLWQKPISVPAESEYAIPRPWLSAGVFALTDNVTTIRNPKVTADETPNLPYVVQGTDIVLEGIGWVELTVQIRKNEQQQLGPAEVVVASPEGKGVGQRETLAAYCKLLKGAKLIGKGSSIKRSRKSMKGAKKMAKAKAKAKA